LGAPNQDPTFSVTFLIKLAAILLADAQRFRIAAVKLTTKQQLTTRPTAIDDGSESRGKGKDKGAYT